MNNRKRMILKAVEVCYRKGKIDKCTKRMDLAYAFKELVRRITKILREWYVTEWYV